MKLLFFGSGEFGLPTLERLTAEHEVLAVVTQPDRPAGRKRVPTPTPIGAWAEAQGLPVHKADDVNTPQFVQLVSAYGAEASVVIAFGQKLSPELIDAMGRLAVNLHASLLPKYRGAAPINWAMIHGDTLTGVSVIGLAPRMDAGAVYAAAELPIDPKETAGELHDRLAQLGPASVSRVLDDLTGDTLSPIEQDESEATKAPRFKKGDGTVSFEMAAPLVRARIHGLTPWPGCRVAWRGSAGEDRGALFIRRVADEPDTDAGQPAGVVLDGGCVACDTGVVRLLELQKPGGKVMAYADFVRGHPIEPGDRLEPWSG